MPAAQTVSRSPFASAFGFRKNTRFDIAIATPNYDGGTYSNPSVIQQRLKDTTLSYDFILLKNYADPTTPIIIDSDAEIRWVSTAGVRAPNCILFDNACSVLSGSSLLRTEFDGVTTPVADYSRIAVTGFHRHIDEGREEMILDIEYRLTKLRASIWRSNATGNLIRTWNLADIISAAIIAGGYEIHVRLVCPAPNDSFHNRTPSAFRGC